MAQNNEVLTREDNRVSPTCATRTTMQEDYQAIMERELAVNTIEQTWISGVGEMTRAGRTTPKSVNPLVKIMKWLNHLGSGRIDDASLESRHNIHHNFRTNDIRF